MWFVIAAIAIALVSIGVGIGYLLRNAGAFKTFTHKRRNATPENLDRSPDEPHMPGATS